jgi:hypothetical protein
VKQWGGTFEYVSSELKTKELCLAAVEEYGLALEYVPEELKTKELCLAAVEQHGGALLYVPFKYVPAIRNAAAEPESEDHQSHQSQNDDFSPGM